MTATERITGPAEQQVDKGLKARALGLVSTTIVAAAEREAGRSGGGRPGRLACAEAGEFGAEQLPEG